MTSWSVRSSASALISTLLYKLATSTMIRKGPDCYVKSRQLLLWSFEQKEFIQQLISFLQMKNSPLAILSVYYWNDD